MKKQILIWIFVLVILVLVFFAFNYQGGEDSVPLSQIFGEETEPGESTVTYIYVDDGSPKKEENVEVEITLEMETSDSIVDPKSVIVSESSRSVTEVPFTIQIASYKDKVTAERALKDIKAKGIDPYLVSKDLKDKGVWYRVYVGKYETEAQAQNALEHVQEKFENAFILSTGK